MSNFLDAIAQSSRLASQSAELVNRIYGLQIGIVSDNRDPLKQRRIKVSPQSKAGLAPTDWLAHCNPSPSMDAPIPAVGATVFFMFLDGDPHDGVWLGVTHNDTNPPDPTQTDPVNDNAIEIPGNDRRTVVLDGTYQVVGDRTDETDRNHKVQVGDKFNLTTQQGEITITAELNQVVVKGQTQVRFEDGSGGYIVMSGGALRFGNASGQEWVLGGASGTEWVWNANGSAISVVGASDFTIAGKSVLTVGSVDTRNDTNVTRGW